MVVVVAVAVVVGIPAVAGTAGAETACASSAKP